MTAQGRDKRGEMYTEKGKLPKSVDPSTFPAKKQAIHNPDDQPKILIPEGSITEYTNIQYRLSIIANLGI